MPVFDRRVPTDWKHVEKYGLRTVQPQIVAAVERKLYLPPLRSYYDQGKEGACVGFGTSWALSIMRSTRSDTHKYDAGYLYHQAQLIDEWPETPPEEGTSVRAGMDFLRGHGPTRIRRGVPMAELPIASNRWATTVDEVRTAIADGYPVVLGINWYRAFSYPDDDGWIGKEIGNWGPLDGGHCICCRGSSDRIQGVHLVQSWGPDVPLLKLSYEALDRLLREYGEAGVMIL